MDNVDNATRIDGIDNNAVHQGFLLVGLAAIFSIVGAWLPILDRLNWFTFKFSDSKAFLAGSISLAAGVWLTFH